MKKSFVSIIVSIAMITNISICTTETIYATAKSSNETYTSTQTVSALEQGIKELLSKDVFKTAMDNESLHEILKKYFNQEASKNLKDYIRKSNIGINITDSDFKTDEAAYKWLSNAICATLKNAINKGNLKQSDIDQINSTIGMLSLFGIKKISIDLTKKDYTDKEIEKIIVELLPSLDKLLNPLTLKLAGIDLKDKKFWDEFVKLIENALE